MFFNFLTYTYKYFTYVFRSHYLCLLTFLDLITYVYLRLLAPLLISRYLSITAISRKPRGSNPNYHDRRSTAAATIFILVVLQCQWECSNIIATYSAVNSCDLLPIGAVLLRRYITFRRFSVARSSHSSTQLAASLFTPPLQASSIHPKRPSSLTQTSSTALYCPKTFRLASKPSNFLRALTKLYHHGASQEKAEEWC